MKHTPTWEPGDLLTTKQVAEITGLKETTLRGMRHVGTGPRSMRIESAVRYHRADVEAYLNAAYSKAVGA